MSTKFYSVPLFKNLLFCLFVLLSVSALAQPCACDNCPEAIPDFDSIHYTIKVGGATNNDLASPTQAICKININFKHDFVSDLQMSLMSPSGQMITLIAPISQTGFTNGASWNVSFVPCAEIAYPDPGFPAQWTNGNWGTFGNYKGSYYPFNGCLEDFNTGTVNGVWKLIVQDGDPNYDGTVLNWSITFCDPTGLDCLDCIADGGDLTKAKPITACKSANALIFTPFPSYTPVNPPPPVTYYSYTYVISKNNIVMGFQNPINMTTYQAGDYEVCGLSYLTADAPKLPIPNGILTTTQLKALMSGVKPSICGDFSKGCITIKIVPTPTPVLIDTSVCKCFSFDGIDYCNTGFYTKKLTAKNGCDSTVFINLTVIAPISKDTFATICQGQTFKVGKKSYNQTGAYKDTIPSFQTGCDSIVNLFLIVKSALTNNLSREICEGDTVKIGSEKYTKTGFYIDTLQNKMGCDSIVRLDLKVKTKSYTFIEKTLCNKAIFSINNKNYNKTGVFRDTLKGQNQFFCDSVLVLTIKALPEFRDTFKLNICEGDTVRVGKNKYFKTGFYSDFLTTKNTNCDSLIFTDLMVSKIITRAVKADICKGILYPFDGTVLATPGVYTAKNTSKNGCDSLTTLTLVVHPNPAKGELNYFLCYGESITIEGKKFTKAIDTSFLLKSKYLCDSVLTLSVKVIEKIDSTIIKTICSGDSVNVGTKVYKQTGIFTQITTSKLYGCDSTITLNLTVLTSPQTKIDTTLCFGKTIKIGTSIFDKTGVFSIKLTAKNTCDSLVSLNLRVLLKKDIFLKKQICNGNFFSVGTKKYAVTGNYIDTLKSPATGCDSIVYLDLTTVATIKEKIKRQICLGESVLVGVKKYTQTGIFTDTLKSPVGACDSIVTLDLTLFLPDSTHLKETLCDGKCAKIGAVTYCKSGFYKNKLKNKNACDSIVTLDLTIKKKAIKDFTQFICQGDTVKIGTVKKYYESGIYNDTLVGLNGCDSVVILDLFVIKKDTSVRNIRFCNGESINIDGMFFDKSGVFYKQFKSKKTGCDSVVRFNVVEFVKKETVLKKTICKGQSYLSFSKTGKYAIDTLKTPVTNCDSVLYIELIVLDSVVTNLSDTICQGNKYELGGQIFDKTGLYRLLFSSVAGCDSIVRLSLNVFSCFVDYRLNIKQIGCESNEKGSLEIVVAGFVIGKYKVSIKNKITGAIINGTAADGLPFLAQNLDAGVYVVTVSNFLGNKKEETIEIQYVTKLKAFFSKASDYQGFNISCVNASDGFLETMVSGGQKPFRYNWSNFSNFSNLKNLKAGKYTVTVTDTLGCQIVIDTTLFAPSAAKIHFSHKNLSCYDVKEGEIQIDSVVGKHKPYTYALNLKGYGSEKNYKNLESNLYLISVKDARGCRTDTSIFISQPPKIVVDLGKDTTITLGETVFVEATTNLAQSDISKHFWNQFVTPTCSTCLTTTVRPTISTGYLLFLTDKNGCQGFDVKTVFVRDTLPVYAPTSFSPNDDGINDTFMLFSKNNILTINYLRIYNRWGSLLFNNENLFTNDTSMGWDGTFKNILQSQDVYIFIAEISLFDGSKRTIKGEIMLMR